MVGTETGKKIEVRWWDEAETILYHGYFQEFEGEEFKNSLHHANALIAAKPHPVDVMIDYRHMRTFPFGALLYGYEALRQTPVNVQYIYVMMPELTAIKLLYTTFVRLNNHIPAVSKYRLMLRLTPEDVYQQIMQERQTI